MRLDDAPSATIEGVVLLFELVPAVFALVALLVGIGLYAMNHGARNEPEDPPPAAKRRIVPGVREERGPGRPSMR